MARARKQVRGVGPASAGKRVSHVVSAADLVVTNRQAAGIDVHAAEHFVAVAPEDVPAAFVNPDCKLPVGVRKFGTNTADLEAIADWLTACGVATVAMARQLKAIKIGRQPTSFLWWGPAGSTNQRFVLSWNSCVS
jgi:hypothetical protein